MHHKRSPGSRETQVPSSRGEANSTQGKSRRHKQHSPYPLLLHMWERLLCPDWPYQPSADSPKNLDVLWSSSNTKDEQQHPYVTRMLPVCNRMYPYVSCVTRMLPVCYSWYSCGVLVMIRSERYNIKVGTH